jgi:hypothetical protein
MDTKFKNMSWGRSFAGKKFIVKAVAVTALWVAGSGHAQGEVDSPIIPGLSIAAQWNELALAGVRDTGARPTVTTWQLFIASAAMYDALSMYSEDSTPYALPASERQPVTEHTTDNREAAVSQAAYQALIRLYPEFESSNGYFRTYLNQLGYEALSSDDGTAAGTGFSAADAVFTKRSNDGSNFQNDFAPVNSERFPEPYVPVNSPDPISEIGIFGDDFDPNRWQPLRVPNGTLLNEDELAVVDDLNLDSFGDQQFLTPHWGAVTPFALADSAQFRPTAPPLVGSFEPYEDANGIVSTNDAAYRSQVAEVLQESETLTDRKKVIAEFWADGPRTESPPGHWNQLAHGVIERDEMNLTESVHLFFTLNGALLDAGIATWEAKRFYDYIRPASAIRWLFQGTEVLAWGGPNRGTELIPAEQWQPYQSITFVTPPFPEYVSGHSTFSRASAEVLTAITGSETFYDGETTTIQDVNSDGIPDVFGEHIATAGSFFIEEGPADDVVLQWDTYRDAADEAGISRLFGGIHIQDGDLRGRVLGEQVGLNAISRAQSYIDGTFSDDTNNDGVILAMCIDTDGDGYGWNGFATCDPADPDNQEPLLCIDSDGDGYGWNGFATCDPQDPQPANDEPVTLAQCIDSDGDGFGWNGFATCDPGSPDDQEPLQCIDSDGDGYGWNGFATCDPSN